MGPPFPHLVTWGGHYLSSFRRFVSEVKIMTPLSPSSQGQPGVRSERSVPPCLGGQLWAVLHGEHSADWLL